VPTASSRGSGEPQGGRLWAGLAELLGLGVLTVAGACLLASTPAFATGAPGHGHGHARANAHGKAYKHAADAEGNQSQGGACEQHAWATASSLWGDSAGGAQAHAKTGDEQSSGQSGSGSSTCHAQASAGGSAVAAANQGGTANASAQGAGSTAVGIAVGSGSEADAEAGGPGGASASTSSTPGSAAYAGNSNGDWSASVNGTTLGS
jgi:hypothetical protein